MRFLLSILLVAVLCGFAEVFLPWWSIAVVCFLVSLFLRLRAGKAFLMGFLGVALLWFIAAMLHDVSNQHILSTRMAALFHLPDYPLFIVVTVFIGGVVGGLSSLAGSLMRKKV